MRSQGLLKVLPQALQHCSGVPLSVVQICSALKQALKHHLASALCVGVFSVGELRRNGFAASCVVHVRRLMWTQSCAVPVLVLVLLAQQGLQCLLARQGLLRLLTRQQWLLAPVKGGVQRVESGPDYTVMVKVRSQGLWQVLCQCQALQRTLRHWSVKVSAKGSVLSSLAVYRQTISFWLLQLLLFPLTRGVSATLPQALEHCSGVPMSVVRISSALTQALQHHLASSMVGACPSHLPWLAIVSRALRPCNIWLCNWVKAAKGRCCRIGGACNGCCQISSCSGEDRER